MKTYKILFLLSAVLIFTACNQTQKEQTIAEDSQEMNIFFGDLHNHCNLTYGHGDMRDAFEAAKQQLTLFQLRLTPCGQTFPAKMTHDWVG